MRLLKKSSSAPLFSSCFPPPRTLGFNSPLNYKPPSNNSRQINENENDENEQATAATNDIIVFEKILLHNYCRGRFPVKQVYFPKKIKFSQ